MKNINLNSYRPDSLTELIHKEEFETIHEAYKFMIEKIVIEPEETRGKKFIALLSDHLNKIVYNSIIESADKRKEEVVEKDSLRKLRADLDRETRGRVSEDDLIVCENSLKSMRIDYISMYEGFLSIESTLSKLFKFNFTGIQLEEFYICTRDNRTMVDEEFETSDYFDELPSMEVDKQLLSLFSDETVGAFHKSLLAYMIWSLTPEEFKILSEKVDSTLQTVTCVWLDLTQVYRY